jgi:hypothetical protein
MIVFPESLNAMPKDTEKAIGKLSAYIKYMCQRTEWAVGNMTKNVSAAGVSSAETYTLLLALQGTVSALQSTVNSHSASISALLQSVTTLSNDQTALAGRVTALEQRVTALENNNTEGT